MAKQISEVVYNLMVGLGGRLCGVCDSNWHDKDDPVCQECEIEIKEVVAEAENWQETQQPREMGSEAKGPEKVVE